MPPDDNKTYIKKDLKPKKIPMQPRVVLRKDYASEAPAPKGQKIYRPVVVEIQLVANCIRPKHGLATRR